MTFTRRIMFTHYFHDYVAVLICKLPRTLYAAYLANEKNLSVGAPSHTRKLGIRMKAAKAKKDRWWEGVESKRKSTYYKATYSVRLLGRYNHLGTYVWYASICAIRVRILGVCIGVVRRYYMLRVVPYVSLYHFVLHRRVHVENSTSSGRIKIQIFSSLKKKKKTFAVRNLLYGRKRWASGVGIGNNNNLYTA